MSDPKKKRRVRSGLLATREDRITYTPEQAKRTLGLLGMLGAGATPGVGEAMDAHDLATGLRDRQYGKAGLAGLGLALPFVAMGSLKRVGGEVADAVTPTQRPLIPWSKAPQELRDEYLNSLEGIRNPIKPATDIVSRAHHLRRRDEIIPSLKRIAPLSAIAAALGLRNRERR